jgi:AcrR family transcriptional regulator
MNKRSGIESREKIIHAALDVFSVQGYSKASIRDIAKKAGISVGGIYLYFRNKEELYRNLINEGRRDVGARIATTVQEAKSATQALSNFLAIHLEFARKHRDFILLHLREHGFAFGMNEKKQFFKTQRELIEKILIRGMQAGEFRKCNVRETARIILASMRGVILSIALDEGVIVKPGAMEEFVFNGILKV